MVGEYKLKKNKMQIVLREETTEEKNFFEKIKNEEIKSQEGK